MECGSVIVGKGREGGEMVTRNRFKSYYLLVFFFFFSSRRRHTRYISVTGVQTCALPIYASHVFGWRPLWFVLFREMPAPSTITQCLRAMSETRVGGQLIMRHPYICQKLLSNNPEECFRAFDFCKMRTDNPVTCLEREYWGVGRLR